MTFIGSNCILVSMEQLLRFAKASGLLTYSSTSENYSETMWPVGNYMLQPSEPQISRLYPSWGFKKQHNCSNRSGFTGSLYFRTESSETKCYICHLHFITSGTLESCFRRNREKLSSSILSPQKPPIPILPYDIRQRFHLPGCSRGSQTTLPITITKGNPFFFVYV